VRGYYQLIGQNQTCDICEEKEAEIYLLQTHKYYCSICRQNFLIPCHGCGRLVDVYTEIYHEIKGNVYCNECYYIEVDDCVP